MPINTPRPFAASAVVAMMMIAAGMASCTPESKSDVANPSTPEPVVVSKMSRVLTDPEQIANGLLPAASDAVITMTGRVEKMGWTKTPESWTAGGSDYYVLVRDSDPSIPKRERRIILRETIAFPHLDDFQNFAGRAVIIRGREAGYFLIEQHPMMQTLQSIAVTKPDGTTVSARRFGGGLLVDAITVLEPVNTASPK